jgi:hypothetical protein
MLYAQNDCSRLMISQSFAAGGAEDGTMPDTCEPTVREAKIGVAFS